MGTGVIGRRLYPSDHLQLRESARDAVLVRLLDPIPDTRQQFVGIPVLGVVILDIAPLDVADHHDPLIVLMGADDQADKDRFIDNVAERTQHARAFGLRHEEKMRRKLQRGLVNQRNVGRALFPGRAGGLPCRHQFRLARGFTWWGSLREHGRRCQHDPQYDTGSGN